MAGKRITDLPLATTSTATDVFPIVQNGVTKQIPFGSVSGLSVLAASSGSSLVGFLQSGTGAVPRTVESKERDIVSGNDFGAVGDNSTTDTTTYQVALDSGRLDINPASMTGYKVGALVVPTTIKSLSGQRFYQAAAGANVLSVTNSTLLRVSDSEIYGVAGTASASSNTGIDATGCSNLRVTNNYFQNLRFHAVHLKSCNNCIVSGNMGYANVLGVRLTDSEHIQIVGNQFYDPQTPDNVFTVCVGLDTDGVSPSGLPRDVVIANNLFKKWVFAQAILIHNGEDVVVSGNNFDDCLIGVHVSPYTATDVAKNITITGNNYRGTSTTGADTSVGNNGILAGGNPSVGVIGENIAITGNTVTNANAINQLANQGGIVAGDAENVTITGNSLSDNYYCGILIYRSLRGVSVTGNVVKDSQTVSAVRYGIAVGLSGNVQTITGVISGNTLKNHTQGIRVQNEAAVSCSITSSGTTATVTLVAHGFKVGDWVRVSGVTFASAADGFYNGQFKVATVPTADTFTYTMTTAAATATAPGSPVVKPTHDLYIEDNAFEDCTTDVSDPGSNAVLDGARFYVRGDKTPYVAKTSSMYIANSSAVVLTNLRGGQAGQTIVLAFGDSNTSIAASAPFALTGAFTSGVNDTLTLMYDGATWLEIARSNN
jgi:parallel beta-helix repeat protein